MATTRPLVTVQKCMSGQEKGDKKGEKETALMPAVFGCALRPDLVRFVVTNLAKNCRQAYGVSPNAGYQTSAESWGTGRAVSRISRVPGGGTHRSGQAAFGNMCRGGGMFAPNKTWRRWHRRVNGTLRRHAVATAIAATGLPALVMARGHRVDAVPELPLVLEDAVEAVSKTKAAVQVLCAAGCGEELRRTIRSKKLRCGGGKARGRRYVLRRGPLVVYRRDAGIARAFRNVPGVDLCHVDRLNVLKLAPGGTLGRLCLWSASAFKRLHQLYGAGARGGHPAPPTAPRKTGYRLPRPLMHNADLARIVNSSEVQGAVRPQRRGPPARRQHKNLLTNKAVHIRVNPAAKTTKRNASLAQITGSRPHAIIQKKKAVKRLLKKTHRKASRQFVASIRRAFDDKAKAHSIAPPATLHADE